MAFEAAALSEGACDAEPQADSSGTIRLNAIAVLIVCAARPRTSTSIQTLPLSRTRRGHELEREPDARGQVRLGIPSDAYGALPVKRNDLLSVTSILSALLLALHISQDIVFGFDRAGLNHLVGVAILLVLVCGAVLLRERLAGTVIMLLGGLMAAGMLPLHMRNGLRPEFLEKSGALLFIWTLYVLGVIGALSVILAVRALLARRAAS